MPNHFHILIIIKEDINTEQINKNIGVILRSYTRTINSELNKTGSLFQQNTKAKILNTSDYNHPDENYALYCFYYIHQNPIKAGLVNKLEDWEYSSFKDFIGLRKGTLVNINLARELLGLPDTDILYKSSNELIPEDKLSFIR
jgi:hypothetical protein